MDEKQDYLWINSDKNKTNNWLKRTRVQFPVGISQYGLIKSIAQNQKENNQKMSLKEYSEEIGLCFSDKEDTNLFDTDEEESRNQPEQAAQENI